MNYFVYGIRHRLCTDLTINEYNFTPELAEFCESRNLKESDGVSCAYDKGKLIGFFRFDFEPVENTLYANGTYIEPEYRGKNVAFTLWSKVLKKHRPQQVVAIITSDGAERLILKLQKKFRKVMFSWSIQHRV